MKRDGTGIRLSASDLMRFMACPHATSLDLLKLDGKAPEAAPDSEDAALLQDRGNAHEAAYLAQLEDDGNRVIRIETDGVPFEQAVAATCAALKDGPDIIFQGALEGGMWGGHSDFLERVEAPSALGRFSFEVADTKLKRKPAPGHILQLVLYSDLLTPLQKLTPAEAHVQLGNGERFSFRLSEYSAYARAARDQLEAFVADPPETRPIPCATCGLCRWREHCAEVWEETDSLYRIAGISRVQVDRLQAHHKLQQGRGPYGQ